MSSKKIIYIIAASVVLFWVCVIGGLVAIGSKSSETSDAKPNATENNKAEVSSEKSKEEAKTETTPSSSATQTVTETSSAPVSSNAPSASLGVVKKSSTGICHAPGTTYYDKTKNFTPFNSLEECLASGGRLPKK